MRSCTGSRGPVPQESPNGTPKPSNRWCIRWLVLLEIQHLPTEGTEGGSHDGGGWEGVPFGDRPGEEGKLSVIRSALNPLELLWVLGSGMAERGRRWHGFEVWGVNSSGALVDLVEHCKTILSASGFQGRPFEFFKHSTHTLFLVMFVEDVSGCTSLDFLHVVYSTAAKATLFNRD